jgi:hypothetical protein
MKKFVAYPLGCDKPTGFQSISNTKRRSTKYICNVPFGAIDYPSLDIAPKGAMNGVLVRFSTNI